MKNLYKYIKQKLGSIFKRKLNGKKYISVKIGRSYAVVAIAVKSKNKTHVLRIDKIGSTDLTVITRRISLYLDFYPSARVVVGAYGLGYGLVENLRRNGISCQAVYWNASCRYAKNIKRYADNRTYAYKSLLKSYQNNSIVFDEDIKPIFINDLLKLPFNIDKRNRLSVPLSGRLALKGIWLLDELDVISYLYVDNLGQ